MKDTIYVVWTKSGIARTVKTLPNAKLGEFPVKLTLTLSDSVFAKRPVPVVEVLLDAPQMGAALVTVDGEQQSPSVDEAGAQQSVVQSARASLLDHARTSKDPDTVTAAQEAFARLMEAGVKVKLTEQPEDEIPA